MLDHVHVMELTFQTVCSIVPYSIGLYFHHQIHPQLGVVIALAQPLHLEGLILKLKLQYFGYLM